MKYKIMALCLGVMLALGLAGCGAKRKNRQWHKNRNRRLGMGRQTALRREQKAAADRKRMPSQNGRRIKRKMQKMGVF